MPTGEDLAILARTLGIALVATLLVIPPGLGLALLLARRGGAVRTVVEAFATLPVVLPPTAVGLLLLDVFARRSPLGRALDAASIDVLFDPKGAAIAAAVMAFPLFYRAARTALEEVDPRLVDVARTLGRTRLGALWSVVLPLAARGLAAGVLLAFARAVGEFGATILVAGNIPGRTQTLSLAIFQRVQIGDDAGARRLLLLVVIVAFAAVWGTELLARRRRA
jgi:molybdate transport system permease protein